MLEFSEPKVLFEKGHTLSLIEYHGTFFGYLGHVLFDKVEVYSGKDLYNLSKVGELDGYRWGSAVVFNDKVFLFCTRQDVLSRLPLVNPYRFQRIFLLVSEDGIVFENKGEVLKGSAPSVYQEDGLFYLLFHRRNPHQILFHTTENPGIINAKKVSLLKSTDFTLSAPSLVTVNGEYWLVCEYLDFKNVWRSLLFRGDSLDYLRLDEQLFLENGACAFQHIFGDRYVLTYSDPNGKESWRLMVKEAKL